MPMSHYSTFRYKSYKNLFGFDADVTLKLERQMNSKSIMNLYYCQIESMAYQEQIDRG